MKKMLVRHAETDMTRLTRHQFGFLGGPINEAGIKSAHKLGEELMRMGIDFDQEVAVSEQIRTQQTARECGFKKLVINPLLNEVDALDPARTNKLVEMRELPDEAIEAGRRLLADPPAQLFWFTHGQITAAVLDRLGYAKREDYILRPAGIFEIDLYKQ